MATNYPTSLDALTNPSSNTPVFSPGHADQHANANDAIEALQAKVGVDSSAVATSLDYRVAALEALPANPSKATGAELNTGTDDAKFATAKALADSDYAKTSDITASAVGLGNVDNTSDANKPVSTATQSALDLKLNNTDILWGGLIKLSGINYVYQYNLSVNSGDTDIYTCPVGKKAMVLSSFVWNYSGSTANVRRQVYTNSAYYYLTSSSSVLNAAASSNMAINYILESGEKFAINSDQSGLSVNLSIIEFADTVPMKTSKITTFIVGNNVVYTVPEGKTAFVLNRQNLKDDTNPSFSYTNHSGGTTTWHLYVVPSGEAVDNNTTRITYLTLTNNNSIPTNLGQTLFATGTQLVLNSDSSGKQLAWISIIEI